MSRIGKKHIVIPGGVTIEQKDRKIIVKGSKGVLDYSLCDKINVDLEDNHIIVTRENDESKVRALHGLTRALIQNMVTGVSEGYEKVLNIIGTGYSSERIGPWLKLSVGYSHDVLLEVPKNIEVSAEAVPRGKGGKLGIQSIIRIKGFHKEDVGKFAAEVRKVRPPENYKGKGIRYENEFVRIKAGKSGSK
ncbi:MAG: 50S ribosomal protein L6 [Candidatus Cloacimonetes bacterium]|jgi:large subunit ribosomal protein L6|nr:50S ribosomal protein L6 [Candidatus Cloacimonadota bacterium]MDD4155403.1 50S ribosomal protein L6 [Candidatus Cloacimonadota bacterium]